MFVCEGTGLAWRTGLVIETEFDWGKSFLVTLLTGGAGGGGLQAKFGDPGTPDFPALASRGDFISGHPGQFSSANRRSWSSTLLGSSGRGRCMLKILAWCWGYRHSYSSSGVFAVRLRGSWIWHLQVGLGLVHPWGILASLTLRRTNRRRWAAFGCNPICKSWSHSRYTLSCHWGTTCRSLI